SKDERLKEQTISLMNQKTWDTYETEYITLPTLELFLQRIQEQQK
ncbi:2243_t:CDS:2, partial [Gigaspora margarita]